MNFYSVRQRVVQPFICLRSTCHAAGAHLCDVLYCKGGIRNCSPAASCADTFPVPPTLNQTWLRRLQFCAFPPCPRCNHGKDRAPSALRLVQSWDTGCLLTCTETRRFDGLVKHGQFRAVLRYSACPSSITGSVSVLCQFLSLLCAVWPRPHRPKTRRPRRWPFFRAL